MCHKPGISIMLISFYLHINSSHFTSNSLLHLICLGFRHFYQIKWAYLIMGNKLYKCLET